jgi:hypothetical protein
MFLNLVAKANVPQDPEIPLFSRFGSHCVIVRIHSKNALVKIFLANLKVTLFLVKFPSYFISLPTIVTKESGYT